MARHILSITGTRADYGLMRPVHKAIEASPALDLTLVVTGMQLHPAFAEARREIDRDGFRQHVVEIMPDGESGRKMARALGAMISAFADAFAALRPDILLLQGDRGEMLAGAIAAVHLNIPTVHMSGGDRSGTIDDSLRAAISRFAHFHLTTAADSTERLVAMGEDRRRILTVGEPALDVIHDEAAEGRALIGDLAGAPGEKLVLATQHPVTTEADDAARQMEITLEALDRLRWRTIFTYPNTDAGGAAMTEVLERWNQRRLDWLTVIPTLGARRFLALLARADVLVGNSSSGILEAPSFHTPVVNVGTRQFGRLRAGNVLDVEHDVEAIADAMLQATEDATFGARLAQLVNPYGDGQAARRTRHVLEHLILSPALVAKWLPTEASPLTERCDEAAP